MPLPFEFVITGPPVSQQSSRSGLRRWRQKVRNAAVVRWGPEAPLSAAVDVMVTIHHFYDGARLDVDNIPKPILDSLIGIVYPDDALVTDIICRARILSANPSLHNATDMLLDALADGDEFLHIRVENAPGQEVHFD